MTKSEKIMKKLSSIPSSADFIKNTTQIMGEAYAPLRHFSDYEKAVRAGAKQTKLRSGLFGGGLLAAGVAGGYLLGKNKNNK